MKLNAIDLEQTGNELGTRLGTSRLLLSVTPIQTAPHPLSKPLPALCAQAPRRPDLVRLRPLGLRLGQAFFEHLADRNARPRFDPRSDDFFPGVAFVAVDLLIRRQLNYFGSVQPPDAAGLEPRRRFRP